MKANRTRRASTVKQQQTTTQKAADAIGVEYARAFLAELRPDAPGVRHIEIEARKMSSGSLESRVVCVHEACVIAKVIGALAVEAMAKLEPGDVALATWQRGEAIGIGPLSLWREPDALGGIVYYDCAPTCPIRRASGEPVQIRTDANSAPRHLDALEAGCLDWWILPMGEVIELFRAGKLNALPEPERRYLAEWSESRKPSEALYSAAVRSRFDRLSVIAVRRLLEAAAK